MVDGYVSNYVIALGHVGTKLVSKAVEIGGGTYRRESTVTGLLWYAERAVEDVEFQIIDMGIEDEKVKEVLDELIREHGFAESDQIYALELREEKYRGDNIKRSINLDKELYPNLFRYYTMFVSPLLEYLRPRRGVQRYRPLAKYFIMDKDIITMLRRYFTSDIEEDIGKVGERLRLIAVLSSGGGFGSGSLLYVLSLLTTLLESQGVTNYSTKVLMNIPVGHPTYVPSPQDLAPVDGLEGTKASSAALLLELLYLYRRNPDKRTYFDELLARAYEASEIDRGRARLAGIDELILTTLAGIAGRDIASVYENHDEEVGRFLYSEAVKELGPFQENLGRLFSDYMSSVATRVELKDFAKELLVPVTVIGVASVQVDPGKISNIVPRLEEKSKELDTKRKEQDSLKNSIDEARKRMIELQERASEMERELSELQPDRLKADASLAREILEFESISRTFIPTQISYLETMIKQLPAFEIDRARAEIERALIRPLSEFVEDQRIVWLLNRANELVGEYRKLMGSEKLSEGDIKELKELGKLKILLEEIYKVLTTLKGNLENLKKELDGYAQKVKPSFTDKIFNKSKVIVYSKLTRALEIVGESIDKITDHLNKLGEELKSLGEFYNGKLKEKSNELSGVKEQIKNLEDEIKSREQELSRVSSEMAELESECGRLYEDISKEMLRDLQKYYGGILWEVNLSEFVKKLKEVMSEQGGKLGISTIVEALSRINRDLADRVVEAIARHISRLGYFATLEPEENRHLAALLGLREGVSLDDYLREYRYVIVSPDNEKLAEDIMRRTGIRYEKPYDRPIVVKKAKTSFITYVRRRVAVPIQIKEVRDCLRTFFTVVRRYVNESIEPKEKTVEEQEYMGKAYLTLDVNDREFNEYLERVRKSLELFESRLSGRAPT